MKLEGYVRSSHGALEALAFRSEGEAQAKAPETERPNPGFVAVEGGSEVMSGETLLVEAYAALWIILLGFVLISWRRQAQIDARIDELERSVSRGQPR